jgi:molybdopterin converting factor small subunit
LLLHQTEHKAASLPPTLKANNQTLNNAYQNQQSDVQVNGSGTVIRTLTDDLKGSQHQRFLVKLASGNTILIAHNIDLAPRINALREGDMIEFYGEQARHPTS